uniref:Protein kinase domain-containing protein n=1 Tax=Scylla olivacea TaxID=85551 RepID=A0A0P4WJI1_SCYOL
MVSLFSVPVVTVVLLVVVGSLMFLLLLWLLVMGTMLLLPLLWLLSVGLLLCLVLIHWYMNKISRRMNLPLRACTLRRMTEVAEGKRNCAEVRKRGYLPTVGNIISSQLEKHNLLGMGAYSAVYEVRLLDVPYPICFKVLTEKHGSLKALLRECDNLERLQEVSGLPIVLAVSVEPLGFFMTQHGGRASTMASWGRGRMQPSEALIVGAIYRLCTILHNVHCLRLCHNDIKLNNVVVEVGPGGRVEVTLLDLGLMRPYGCFPWGFMRHRDIKKPLKPFYDPALITGERPCSEETEVYAVGYLIQCLLPLLFVTRKHMKRCSRLAMASVAYHRPTLKELVICTHHALLNLLPHVPPLTQSDSFPSVHLEEPLSSLWEL